MANLRVLLADSDTSFRTTAQRALTRQGYLVIPAANGIDAMALLGDDEIDVVVADVGLPQRDMLELVHAAKAKSPSTPVILLAQPSSLATAATGVREGASDYLVKPLDDLGRLMELVDRVAGQSTTASPPLLTEQSSVAADPQGAGALRLLEAATAGLDLRELLGLFAKELAQLALAPQAIILLAHNDGLLHVEAAHGFADRAEAGRAFVQTGGEEFAYRVAAASDLVEQELPSAKREEEKTPVISLLGVPLLYGREALGVAVVFMTVPRSSLLQGPVETMRYLSRLASLAVELARARGLAERRNPKDPVTGLFNREHFFDQADREFRRSWRFGERIAAVQLDVDEFGKLHLLQGPTETDEMIRQIARTVHQHVRNIDVVGRLDVDKLGMLLLNTPRDSALAVAERLRRSIAEIELATSEGNWQVTASFGVAIYPREQCASVQDLFGLAAQAARAAKRAGHNRVVGV
jgi:diguanylate cyclase (GGDEF)-like protein